MVYAFTYKFEVIYQLGSTVVITDYLNRSPLFGTKMMRSKQQLKDFESQERRQSVEDLELPSEMGKGTSESVSRETQ